MKKEDVNVIQEYINGSKKVLLHCHPNPDPDSVCSVLAMREYLISQGKEVIAIIGDSQYPLGLKRLYLEEKILPLNYFEITPEDFDLFIVLDSSSKQQISRLGEVIFPKGMKSVVIDHHKSNEGFGDINLILDKYASTTHILYDMFNIWNVDISKNMALYFFLGVFADTGGFRYLNSTPEVFAMVSSLVNINPDYHDVVFDIENSRSEIEIKMMALAMSSIKKFLGGKVVFSSIEYGLVKARGLSRDEAIEGLIPDMLRSVEGWDIVASLVGVDEGETVVSLRTRDEKIYDVSKIATSVGVNGGGHAGASGTTIMKDISGAEEELLNSISKLYGKELL